MQDLTQSIEAARQEFAMLQAEIETLKARKSLVECVREPFSQEIELKVQKRKVRKDSVAITISEADFLRLKEQAQSAAWVEQKLFDLKHLGDILWHKLDGLAILKDAIQRAEDAEIRCRSLEHEIDRLKAELVQEYDMDDGGEREIVYLDNEGLEL